MTKPTLAAYKGEITYSLYSWSCPHCSKLNSSRIKPGIWWKTSRCGSCRKGVHLDGLRRLSDHDAPPSSSSIDAASKPGLHGASCIAETRRRHVRGPSNKHVPRIARQLAKSSRAIGRSSQESCSNCTWRRMCSTKPEGKYCTDWTNTPAESTQPKLRADQRARIEATTDDPTTRLSAKSSRAKGRK